MLHAVDLNTGEIRWQAPIGEDKRLMGSKLGDYIIANTLP